MYYVRRNGNERSKEKKKTLFILNALYIKLFDNLLADYYISYHDNHTISHRVHTYTIVCTIITLTRINFLIVDRRVSSPFPVVVYNINIYVQIRRRCKLKKGVEPCLKTNVAITSIIPDKNVIKNGRLKKKNNTATIIQQRFTRFFDYILYIQKRSHSPPSPSPPCVVQKTRNIDDIDPQRNVITSSSGIATTTTTTERILDSSKREGSTRPRSVFYQRLKSDRARAKENLYELRFNSVNTESFRRIDAEHALFLKTYLENICM